MIDVFSRLSVRHLKDTWKHQFIENLRKRYDQKTTTQLATDYHMLSGMPLWFLPNKFLHTAY